MGTRPIYDVIVIGCGPVGATFANCLKLSGRKVAVFDRDVDVFPVPRASGFDDESLRLFQAIDVLDEITEGGHLTDFDTWIYDRDGILISQMNRSILGKGVLGARCGHYHLTICDQPNVERILRSRFAGESGVDSFLGYEVFSLENSGDGVQVKAKHVGTGQELEFRSRYVVGADGATSFVRGKLGTDRIDLEYTENYLIVDAYVDDKTYLNEFVQDGASYIYDKTLAGVVVKGCHGHVRFDILRHPDLIGKEPETTEEWLAAGRALILSRSLDPDRFRIVRTAPYTFRARMPEEWRKGRLFVMGDAAHQTPPWAGQGLNMGVRDAANLAFKLDLVLSGKAPESLLDTYQAERKPECLITIQRAVRNGKLMQTSDPDEINHRDALYAQMLKDNTLARRVMGEGLLRPPYEVGLFGFSHEKSGDMMPQPDVIYSRRRMMMDDALGFNFALISLESVSGPYIDRFQNDLGGVVRTVGREFMDITVDLTRWFEENNVSAALIRPDRYIFDAGNDPENLCKALFEKLL